MLKNHNFSHERRHPSTLTIRPILLILISSHKAESEKWGNLKTENQLRLAFVLSLIAMAGSLFFSEVMKLPPCVLCWYQRICMYPLVIIFAVGLLRTGKECIHYAMPLIGLGLVIAAYHNLLYYHIIPDSITPCTQGLSCTARQIEWLGFITIPLLSLFSFLIMFILGLKIHFSKKG